MADAVSHEVYQYNHLMPEYRVGECFQPVCKSSDVMSIENEIE